LLFSEPLLILIHHLLLRQDFLVIIKLDLLDDHEVMPVDIVFIHVLILFVLRSLSLSDALLLVKPELTLLSCVKDLLTILGEGLVAFKTLTLRHKHG
jgi:hypothetical protein